MKLLQYRTWMLCWLVFGLVTCSTRAEETGEEERHFELRVRPLLAAKCWECHGAERQESGLRLDDRESILRGGDSGEPAVVPGDLKRSRLYAAVRRDGLQMPPDEPLSAEQVADFAAWISAGAPWPVSNAGGESLSIEAQAEAARATHWSFQPIVRPTLPAVKDATWARTGMDRFILAKLESRALRPSPEADRRTLVRRLSFDLLGLPPTWQEVQAFEEDASPDAYQRLVDRLLASPRYGERWGRHWLDVARYADTRGYAFGRERRYPYAYTYRDYVIRSWNADLPYNQFIREQLAADLLPDVEPTALAALGFLTVGRKFNNRHDDLDDQIDVMSRGLLGLTVSCARCHNHKFDAIPTADYYSLYGVFASSQEPADLPLMGRPEDHPGYAAFKQELDRRQATLNQYLDERFIVYQEKMRQLAPTYLFYAYSDLISVVVSPQQAADYTFLTQPADELSAKLRTAWREYLQQRLKAEDPFWGPLHDFRQLEAAQFVTRAPEVRQRWLEKEAGSAAGQVHPLVHRALSATTTWTSPIDAVALYARLISETYRELAANSGQGGSQRGSADQVQDERSAIRELVQGPGSPTAVSRADLPGLFNRADRDRQRELEKQIEAWQASSPGAPPRAMVVVENSEPHQPRIFIRGNPGRPGKPVPRQFLLLLTGTDRKPFQQGSGRRELADQIASADNPLTRRVMANRIWMHHFGTPLIPTPSDLGQRCEPPLHADLLNYLAALLLDQDWSLKALHREIVLSSTYRQQASVADAALPDARASQDPENRLYWRMNRRRLEFESLRDSLLAVSGQLDERMGGRPVESFVQPGEGRRTVYNLIDRQDLPNLLRVFDFASPDQSQAKRPETTVPQQALFLMNSPFVLQQAQHLATQIAQSAAKAVAEKTGAEQARAQKVGTLSAVAATTASADTGVGEPAKGDTATPVTTSGEPAVGNAAATDLAVHEVTAEETILRIRLLYQRLLAREPMPVELESGGRFLLAEREVARAAEDYLTAWQQYVQIVLLTNEFAFYD